MASIKTMQAIVQDRVCRATGARVQVIDVRKDAEHGWDEDEGGRWITFCDRHETFCQHATRALAVYHAADSGVWCGMCEDRLP
jgi:hypothetical protein